MISVQQVSKSFGSVEAIRNVSFEIKQGEVVGFLGPNGAGKTTLMRLIPGFFRPAGGPFSSVAKICCAQAFICAKKLAIYRKTIRFIAI